MILAVNGLENEIVGLRATIDAAHVQWHYRK